MNLKNILFSTLSFKYLLYSLIPSFSIHSINLNFLINSPAMNPYSFFLNLLLLLLKRFAFSFPFPPSPLFFFQIVLALYIPPPFLSPSPSTKISAFLLLFYYYFIIILRNLKLHFKKRNLMYIFGVGCWM